MMAAFLSFFAVFCLLALSSLSSISCSNSSSSSPLPSPSSSSDNHLYILTIPFPGHVNPLLSIAADLSARGWRVTVLSESSTVRHTERQWAGLTSHLSSAPQFSVIDVGRCSVVDEFFPMVATACARNDNIQDFHDINGWVRKIDPCMYKFSIDAIEKIINKGEKGAEPTLFLIDFVSSFAYDVAKYFNKSYVINNADILGIISPATLPVYDFVPGFMSDSSVHYFRSPATYYGLFYRLIFPPFRAIIYLLIKWRDETEFQSIRDEAAMPPVDLWNIVKGKVVFVNSVLGLEYQRPLPPSIQMIGLPMPSNIPSKNELQNGLDSYITEWFQQQPEKKFVFVSFGTLARPSDQLIRSLLRTFTQPNLPFMVVWKLNSTSHALVKEWMNDQNFIPSDGPKGSFNYNNLLITNWVSSQWSILASDKIGAFISHCGLNSAHESLWFAVPLLCIPMFADQVDMGQRVVDSGAGLTITKVDAANDQQNPSLTQQYLQTLIQQPSYAIAAQRVASLLKLAGGASRAADIIEHVAKFGSEDFLSVQEQVPWYVASSLDVYAIYLAFIIFSLASTIAFGRFFRTTLQPVLCWISRKAGKAGKKHKKH